MKKVNAPMLRLIGAKLVVCRSIFRLPMFEWVKRDPRWRLSVQAHKMLGLP